MFEDKPILRTSETEADSLARYVDRVLEAMGFPEAYVTDESTVGDFLDWTARPHGVTRRGEERVERPGDPEAAKANEVALKAWQAALRVPISEEDRIVDVARRVKALGQA